MSVKDIFYQASIDAYRKIEALDNITKKIGKNVNKENLPSDQSLRNVSELVDIEWMVEYSTLSKATIYRLIKAGDLPKGYMITKGRRVWRKDEVVCAFNRMLGLPSD